MPKQSRPCIIGVAQKTWRAKDGYAPHPLQQAAEVVLAAAADSGSDALLSHVDELDLVLPISWSYEDPCEKLAALLSLVPGGRKLSGLSGTSPQCFINEAAESILQDKRRAVVVCGAEAFATLKRAARENGKLDWPPKAPMAFHFDDPHLQTEIAHQVFQAYATFALLDSSRRAHFGVDLTAHRKQQAEMMAALSQVAANNPDAWFQKAHSANDLFELNNSDRMVAYPFSKNMMAIMDVDMAAAVIIASDELANELGIAEEKRIYLHGWGYAKEPPHVAQREDLWRCPSIEIASDHALSMAKMRLSDIKYLDVYSCFPSSLSFSKDALGIADDDNRPLTVTGGLPYFGGPGNNYMTHSVASMVTLLRQEGGTGLVSGIGMHMTNHVIGIYSRDKTSDIALNESKPPAQKVRQVVSQVNEIAKIVAYTILHEKSGSSALAICELTNGDRCYARCNDAATLGDMALHEWVGKHVEVRCNEKMINTFLR
jgi:acetyl-CoA C-acetyltransferase